VRDGIFLLLILQVAELLPLIRL